MSMSAETVFSENERPMREISPALPEPVLLPEISARCMEHPGRLIGVRREAVLRVYRRQCRADDGEGADGAGSWKRRDFGLIFRAANPR